MHFFAQPTLGTDAEAVTDDQHPNHQGRIDRRQARVAVVGSEVLVQFAQVEEQVDPAQQVVGGNVVFQVDSIEQRRLPGVLKTHNRDPYTTTVGTSGAQVQPINKHDYFKAIGQDKSG